MHSKDTVREEGIERDGKIGEERIEDIEGTESDTKIVTELGGRDGEIETIMESTKIGEERGDEGGGWEDVKGKERRLEEQGRKVEVAQRDPQLGPGLVPASPQLLQP